MELYQDFAVQKQHFLNTNPQTLNPKDPKAYALKPRTQALEPKPWAQTVSLQA